ncbi:MAG: tetraacyldisaccharide 4'-kinase [Bacteroidales bacterium]
MSHSPWLVNYSYFYPVVFLRIILFPVSLLYGFLIYIRNKLFDWKIIPSKSYPVPVISIGNLSTGGTGKTPHVEYVIRLLEPDYKVATLSRGYKRKTKGFLLADTQTGVPDIGDEPYQFYSKFPDIKVAVDSSRARGIDSLMKLDSPPEVILLDDAFQHRHVKPGLSILLTDFYKLYTQDYILPSGNLREFRTGARRADIIVITKSPKVLSPITRRRLQETIRPQSGQKVFYSYIQHGNFTAIPGVNFLPGKPTEFATALLVAGIANPYPLEMFLKDKSYKVETLLFPDHHQFTAKDVEIMIDRFDNLFAKNKIIVTTEKDMMRLKQIDLLKMIKNLPLCYVPIRMKFHKQDEAAFDQIILDYVKRAKGDNPIHTT